MNVYIDGTFSFGISELLISDLDIFVGKEVSESDIKKYLEGDSIRKCIDKSYRLLSIRPRSEEELRSRLKEKFNDKDVETCISKLKDYKYINDAEFANMWVNERKNRKGKKALFFELKKKGIPKIIIKEVLSSITEDCEYESAIDLVRRKKKYQNLSKNDAYQKVGGFLSRNGYSYDTVKKVVDEISNN